jgi:excisionase family DNA binding protein
VIDLDAFNAAVDARIARALESHSSTGWCTRSACGVERKTVDGWIKSGEVQSARIGRQVLVRVSDVRAAIERAVRRRLAVVR